MAAEYLLTVTVAQALADVCPGKIRIERLIRRAFCNGFMRMKKGIAIAEDFGTGRIDVVIAEDTNHALPECLIEIKRNINLKEITKDANRIARLINYTNGKLPKLFGVCLFPLILYPTSYDPNNYDKERQSHITKINQLLGLLSQAFPKLKFYSEQFPEKEYTRPSIVTETYEDNTTEVVWDENGFRMEPFAIVIHQ